MYQYYRVIRKAYSFYVNLKVLPYLKLPGPVEIDETWIGPRNNLHFTKHPDKVNWVMGQFCRLTKLAILYFTQSRAHQNLVQLIKRHIPMGTVVITDNMSGYVKACKKWTGSMSRLD
jgi:hypothetical protein